jgi:hypothetical protein
MQETIFSQIRTEEKSFFDDYIQPVEGYTFNQAKTLKRSHLYLDSKFENGGTYLNRELLFFNVVLPPREVAMRMLNLNTKNIRLWPMNPKHKFSTHLLEKELKWWLKKNKIGKMLNNIAQDAPSYGSVVVEKTKDGAELVDLRRLILDPTVDCIQESRFVTTVHFMTPSELRETGWDHVEEAIDLYSSGDANQSYLDEYGNVATIRSTGQIKVYKRFGEVPKSWLDGSNSDENVKALFIVAGADVQELDADGRPVGERGVILFSSAWKKDWPFKDFHYIKTKGRWLGVGIPEMLFDVQVRVNELKNQKRISMEIGAMHLFQTSDNTLVKNTLTDLENGDVVFSKNGITPIDNAERNLAAFNDEESSYHSQVDRLSFAYEAIRGEAGDSSTPLGTTQIAVAQGTSVYAFKKENLSLFWQEFFNDLVMPQLLKDLTAEHIMRYTGSAQELLQLDLAAAEIEANDFAKDQILSGKIFTRENLEELKAKRLQDYRRMGESRFIKIKDAFYDDVEFEFDFLITDEQADPLKIVQNTQAVFLALTQAQQPDGTNMFLDDPRMKVLFDKFAESLGVSTAEIELAEQQRQQLPQAQSGMPVPPQGSQAVRGTVPEPQTGNVPMQQQIIDQIMNPQTKT